MATLDRVADYQPATVQPSARLAPQPAPENTPPPSSPLSSAPSLAPTATFEASARSLTIDTALAAAISAEPTMAVRDTAADYQPTTAQTSVPSPSPPAPENAPPLSSPPQSAPIAIAQPVVTAPPESAPPPSAPPGSPPQPPKATPSESTPIETGVPAGFESDTSISTVFDVDFQGVSVGSFQGVLASGVFRFADPAAVVVALDGKVNRDVALKLLSESLNSNESLRCIGNQKWSWSSASRNVRCYRQPGNLQGRYFPRPRVPGSAQARTDGSAESDLRAVPDPGNAFQRVDGSEAGHPNPLGCHLQQ